MHLLLVVSWQKLLSYLLKVDPKALAVIYWTGQTGDLNFTSIAGSGVHFTDRERAAQQTSSRFVSLLYQLDSFSIVWAKGFSHNSGSKDFLK